mgnify:CR=1 FL=1
MQNYTNSLKMSKFNFLNQNGGSTNINFRQPTFRSVPCKSLYTAVSMSTTTKTTKSSVIQILGFT